MIEVKNLTRYFGQVAAIEQLSFNVEKGEILGFLGPNAAGKTTTMRIIAGYLPATSGQARVGKFDVFTDPIEVKKRIGYLPENPPLYAEMTVFSFLDFIAKIKGIDTRERKNKILQKLSMLGLSDRSNQTIKKLSKGLKQRLGLAQAIINDPEVIIFDEPTIGLDPKQIIEIRELIKNLAEKHTVLLSTHILPEVSMTCQRVVIIDKGRLVVEDTPENLMAKLNGSKEVQATVIGPFEKIQTTLRQIKGVLKITSIQVDKKGNKYSFSIENLPALDIRNQIAKSVVNNGWDLLELKKIEMSLEEVFLQLTTHEEEVSISG